MLTYASFEECLKSKLVEEINARCASGRLVLSINCRPKVAKCYAVFLYFGLFCVTGNLIIIM